MSFAIQSTSATAANTDVSPVAVGSADATKKVRIEADGIATGTTRVITMPNQNIDLTPGVDFAEVGGALKGARTTSAAGVYTVLITDFIVAKTGITGGGDTVTLPTVAAAGAGRIFIIKDEAGTAGTNNITVDGNGAETIDGAANVTISANYGSVNLYCTGTSWMTF